MNKLNLGCGRLHKPQHEGWINIDISEDVGADLVLDVVNGLPFGDNSCDEVHSGCMLEQIDSNKDFIFVMNEIRRVLKRGGIFTGYVPSTDSRVLYYDPMDKRFFQQDSFKYFDIDEQAYQKFGINYGLKPWKDVTTSINENGIIHFRMVPSK